MDGLEQLRHLDMILGIKDINMIQWVQVSSQPDITQNLEYVHKIQNAGKGLVVEASKNQLNTIVNNISPKGLDLVISDAANKKEADEIVGFVAKHSFKKTVF